MANQLCTSDADGNFYDYHTLYVYTNDLPKTEVNKRINAIFKHLDCTDAEYYLNYICTKTAHIGLAYIFIKDKRVFFAITGRNFDGSPRTSREEYDLPYNPPSKPLEVALEEYYKGEVMDWSEDENTIRNRYKPKKGYKETPLPSLISDLNGVVFINDTIDDWDWKPYTKDDDLVLMRARVQEVHEGLCAHKLMTSQIDSKINIADIKRLFKFFSSRDNYPTIQDVSCKGRSNMRRYIITYDPSTKDAYFALLMTKIATIIKANNKYTLFLNYYKYKQVST